MTTYNPFIWDIGNFRHERAAHDIICHPTGSSQRIETTLQRNPDVIDYDSPERI